MAYATAAKKAAYMLEWRRANSEHCREYQRNYHRRRRAQRAYEQKCAVIRATLMLGAERRA
jgi:hypothetical protein